MKRTPKKLNLKRETVRQLGNIELDRARGAGPAVAVDSGDETCPWTHAVLQASGACGGG